MELDTKDLNYKKYLEYMQEKPEFTGFSLARVFTENKGVYKVAGSDKEYLAKITGKEMFSALSREDYPAVGDWVAVEMLSGNEAVIRGVLPRKTVLKKPYSDGRGMQVIAANIDVAFIIESADRDYNLNRYERYLVLVREAKIRPILVLNKVDLISETELKDRLEEIKRRFIGVEVLTTSTCNESGLLDLEDIIEEGKTYCLLGSSGVGKSSIINILLKTNTIKTREISGALSRGKHTTTKREMYLLQNGGILIDNPGIRAVGIADMEGGIRDTYEDLISLSAKCKYSDCTHTHEPGCAVKELMDKGKMDREKYANYQKLKKESEYYKMTKSERRVKDRNFGRLIKKAQKILKEY